MAFEELTRYAESEILRLGLEDTKTNCSGVAAYTTEDGVRLSDGVGLDEICTTVEEIDQVLESMADWYAEVESENRVIRNQAKFFEELC